MGKSIKKIMLFMVLCFFNVTLSAEWTLACSQNQLQWASDGLNNGKYLELGVSSESNIHLADIKSIEVDKKNKIIKFWEIIVYSQESARNNAKQYGQEFAKAGELKKLVVYDIQNKRLKTMYLAMYDCFGNVIGSNNGDEKWNYIVPDTVADGIMNTLKNKYGL